MEEPLAWEQMLLANGFISGFSVSSFQILPNRLDVGVEADDDGFAVDLGFGGLVSAGAGHGEGFARGGGPGGVERDLDVEDVVLDGGFHGCGFQVSVFRFQEEGGGRQKTWRQKTEDRR